MFLVDSCDHLPILGQSYDCSSTSEAILKDMGILTGPRLNIKTVLSKYGDFHVKDKTAVRTSYL